jgi:hypothetical protein
MPSNNQAFFAPLTGLTGAVLYFVLAGSPTQRGTSATLASAAQGRAPAESITVVYGKPDTSPAGFHKGADLLQRFRDSSDGQRPTERYELDVLMMTVPDPMDSHLDWMFDAYLEAIRRALETQLYATYDFWLPWTDSLSAACGRRKAWKQCPGVMLFQRYDSATSATKLRLVYLVGEIPTSGIRSPAFRLALAERDTILADTKRYRPPPSTPADSAPWHTLKIIGPSFSGSALSLRHALESAHTTLTVQMISGSATAITPSILRDSLRRWAYFATVHNNATLDAAFRWQVLKNLRLSADRVAMLSEGATEYGVSQGARADTAPPKVADTTQRPQPTRLSISFPYDIGSLRTAYQRATPAAVATPGNPVPKVSVPLDDPGPRENPPVMSNLTAPAVDQTLDAITQTMRDREVRLVGILATDIRDKLFLVTELRSRIRDLQFFTYESNVLLGRRDPDGALRGMLVVSTYPLVPSEQESATPGRGRRWYFTSDGAEGVYNATLFQLGADTSVIDYAPVPRDGDTTRHGPPVWVSIIGNTGITPLAVWQPPGGSTYLQPMRAPPRLFCGASAAGYDRHPPLVLPFYLTIVVDLLGLTALFVRRRRRDQTPRIERDLYRATLLFALAGISTVLAELTAATRLHLLIASRVISGLTFVLAALLLWQAVVLVARALKRFGIDEAPRMTWDLAGRVILCPIAAFYALATLGVVFSLESAVCSLAGLRLVSGYSVDLSSGLSIFLPLLFAGSALGAWSVWQRWARSLACAFTPFERWSVCFSTPPNVADGRVHAFIRRTAPVRAHMERATPKRGDAGLLLVLLVAAVLFYLKFEGSIADIETAFSSRRAQVFNTVLEFAIIGCVAGTVWVTYKATRIWRALQYFLAGIRNSPLLAAFERISPLVARTINRTVLDFSDADGTVDFNDVRWIHLRALAVAASADLASIAPIDLTEITGNAAPPDLDRRDRCDRDDTYRVFTQLYTAAATLWRFEPTSADICVALKAVERDAASRPADAADDTESAMAGTVSYVVRHSFPTNARLWMRAAEEWLAAQIVDYIGCVLRYIRRLTLLVGCVLVIAVALVSSFPFYPQSYFQSVVLATLVGTTLALVLILTSVNRNEVLSRIVGSRPGHVSFDRSLLGNLAVPGLLLALAILGSIFPGIHDVVASWISPALGATGK